MNLECICSFGPRSWFRLAVTCSKLATINGPIALVQCKPATCCMSGHDSVLHCPTKTSFLLANKWSSNIAQIMCVSVPLPCTKRLVAKATIHLFHELVNPLVHSTYQTGPRFHIQKSHGKNQDFGPKSTQQLLKNVETLTCLRLFGFSQRRTGDLSPIVEKGFGSSIILKCCLACHAYLQQKNYDIGMY